ncbi:nuclear GTPase SLIP-GC-like [Mauremys reevesii]|uniref:nuclear GTPase SLIP-GC-like n=1 Tax=Mauremys reevesii TaxID=260615 RepID=UPI00193F45A3|nr:nuclear GTPase SLIP-GC-like [Mauremys reevesii]
MALTAQLDSLVTCSQYSSSSSLLTSSSSLFMAEACDSGFSEVSMYVTTTHADNFIGTDTEDKDGAVGTKPVYTQIVSTANGAEGEDINESPAKKKRSLDMYRAFAPKKQELLKTYENMESRIRKVLNTTYKKLTNSLSQDNISDEIKYLKNRLLTLKEKSSLDPIYIGLFGSTGAGKSSLLNAIIEQEFFLPVSGNQACTSCMVQVSSSQSKNYEAKIHLLSLQEWKEELKNLVELVRKPREEEEEEEEGEGEDDVGEAVQKLRALYGRDAETRFAEDLLRAKPLVNIPAANCIRLEGAQAKELSDKLDPYVRCRSDKDEEEPALDEEKAKMRLWPLIKYVEVTIPKSDMIPEGVVFMDVPGTGDYHSKRDEMWKESINKCSVIWIISDIEQVVWGKAHEVLLTESIKAYQGGMCSDIALVVTKSDKLQLEEYRRERKEKHKPVETKHDAILERNATVKGKKMKGMKTKLGRILLSDSEILNKADLVYTVSAKEYWRKKYITKEESEIPKLREYVRNICLKEKKKLLVDYVTEVLSIVLLAENFNSTRDMVDHYQQSGLEGFVKDKIKALEKEIEKCFAQLEQPLNEGVKQAKLSHQDAFTWLLTRDTGYQGFHMTLKAECQKNGVYASWIVTRIDLNGALTQPIYDKIDPTFANIFRIRKETRASLKPCLDIFKDSVQEKISEIGIKNPVTSDLCKLNFFTEETNIILRTIEREILKKKMAVYESLPLSIQSDLKPYYEEAAKNQGPRSCQRMQNTLRESIEKKAEDGMFETAKEKMKMQLQELKDYIVTKLQTDISSMLKLALSHREELTKKLPDLQNECQEIEWIYKMLQGK